MASYQKDPWVYVEGIGEVDTESGEVRDVDLGNDLALRLARKADFHGRQKKAHESAERAAKRALLKYGLDEKKSLITEELRSRWVNGRAIEKQDKEAMRLHLESVEVTAEGWRELALAADGFDLSRLPEAVCEMLAPYVTITEGAGYVVVEPAPMLAPERRGPHPKEQDTLAQFEAELERQRELRAVTS